MGKYIIAFVTGSLLLLSPSVFAAGDEPVDSAEPTVSQPEEESVSANTEIAPQTFEEKKVSFSKQLLDELDSTGATGREVARARRAISGIVPKLSPADFTLAQTFHDLLGDQLRLEGEIEETTSKAANSASADGDDGEQDTNLDAADQIFDTISSQDKQLGDISQELNEHANTRILANIISGIALLQRAQDQNGSSGGQSSIVVLSNNSASRVLLYVLVAKHKRQHKAFDKHRHVSQQTPANGGLHGGRVVPTHRGPYQQQPRNGGRAFGGRRGVQVPRVVFPTQGNWQNTRKR